MKHNNYAKILKKYFILNSRFFKLILTLLFTISVLTFGLPIQFKIIGSERFDTGVRGFESRRWYGCWRLFGICWIIKPRSSSILHTELSTNRSRPFSYIRLHRIDTLWVFIQMRLWENLTHWALHFQQSTNVLFLLQKAPVRSRERLSSAN